MKESCEYNRHEGRRSDYPDLCPGYKKVFLHIRKYCHAMTQLLEHGQPVSLIMKAVKGPLVIRLDGMKRAQE